MCRSSAAAFAAILRRRIVKGLSLDERLVHCLHIGDDWSLQMLWQALESLDQSIRTIIEPIRRVYSGEEVDHVDAIANQAREVRCVGQCRARFISLL